MFIKMYNIFTLKNYNNFLPNLVTRVCLTLGFLVISFFFNIIEQMTEFSVYKNNSFKF